jgi:hypothetical protein
MWMEANKPGPEHMFSCCNGDDGDGNYNKNTTATVCLYDDDDDDDDDDGFSTLDTIAHGDGWDDGL